MQDSIYNGIFGALTQCYRLDIIANNLANVNTIGYKKDKVAFEDVLTHYAHDFLDPNLGIKGGVRWPEKDLLVQPRIGEKTIDLSQGSLRQTGNPLDLAIGGKGFFKLNTPKGIFYTRAGNFTLNSEGFITDLHGYKLLSKEGPIKISKNGKINITSDGIVFIGKEKIATLDIVDISDPSSLKKIGENLYKIQGNATERPIKNINVYQGYLESSNVQIVKEMVNMIDTLRTFEAIQKVMTSTNDEDKNLINKVGNPT